MSKINIKPSKRGSLRKHLGVSGDKNIPASKLQIKPGDSAAIRKKKVFAQNARKWKHEEGGVMNDLSDLSSLTGLIPGIGGVAGSVLPMVFKMIESFRKPPGNPFVANTENFKYKKGGLLKQYKAPSHAAGGQMVDANANPTMNPQKAVGEIELQENALMDKSGKEAPYIFSDKLGTSEEAARISRKFKGNTIQDRNARKISFEALKKRNEMLKTGSMFEQGGSLKKYQEGDPLVDPSYYSMMMARRMPQMDLLPTVNPSSVTSMNTTSPFVTTPNLVPGIPQSSVQLKSPMSQSEISQGVFNPVTTDDKLFESEQLKSKLPGMGTMGSIMKGAAFLGSAIDALQPYEREKLQLPDYSRGNQYTQGMGAAYAPIYQNIQQAASKGIEVGRGAGSNFGRFSTGANRALSQAGRDMGTAALQEKQYRDQVSMQLAQRADRQSEVGAAERVRTQNATSANRAMRQDLIANTMSNLNNLGTEFQKQDALKKAVNDLDTTGRRQFILDLVKVNAANPNFQIDGAKLKKALDAEDYDAAVSSIKFMTGGSK
jgi:hypothetical protein